MARLVDVIEMMIKEILDENDGSATISRSLLAEKANCVPSQVTYVLSTRFSPGHGYIVESRRGGGGQITITRAKPMGRENYLAGVLDSVGMVMTQEQCRTILANAVNAGALKEREGRAILAAVTDRTLARVDTEIRSIVRADIFKSALLALMMD